MQLLGIICSKFFIDTQNISSAIDKASLSSMRRRDQNKFIGPAKSGIWRDVLTKKQIKCGLESFMPLMKQLGYSV